MIQITSLDNRVVLKISFAGDHLTASSDFVYAKCSLARGGRNVSVETSFLRIKIAAFAKALSEMHRDLQPQAFASLWSDLGNVAISAEMGERGAFTFKCILAGKFEEIGLFAQLLVDQSYLIDVTRQFLRLSDTYTLYDGA